MNRWQTLVTGLGIAWLALWISFASADDSRHAVPADLLQKAWTEGTARVIVELGGVGAVLEGDLRDHIAIVAQRARIASEQDTLRRALRGLGHRVLREFKTIPYIALEVDHDALRALDSLPGLATHVHEDILLRPLLAQSGPLIKAPNAWAAGWDGTGHVIAILDTGVDKNHPFLTGKVIAEACYSSESSCPLGGMSQVGSGAAVPCTYAPAGCRHGTHVAGIAAGNGVSAGVSFSGVARGANLMAIQVFSQFTGLFCAGDEDPCTRSWTSDQIAGLEHVYDLHDAYDIAAANLSIGGSPYTTPCDGTMPAMDAVIVNLRSVGIATVIASGNDGYISAISFPACISSAISVGATSDGSGGVGADLVMAFSNSAYFLSLLAPGYQINSSVPGGGFANDAGTSMSAPHVAGAWAVAKQANPGASVTDVLAGLQNTGKPILDPGNGITFKRIAATLLQFSASAYTVAESIGTATITVSRSGATFGTVTVDYTTSADTAIAGQDYTDTSGTLTFGPGQTSKTFAISILNDTGVDGARKVNLALSNPGGGALLGARDTAVLTVGDNDVGGSIQFSAGAYSVGEQAGTATITVTRTGGSASNVSVHYATSDGTAHGGVDYDQATGTLTFGANETSRTFQVTILPNGTADGNRTVNLTLTTPSGGAVLGAQKTAVLTLVDDEIALQFSQASYSVNESSGTATITVMRSGPAAPPVGVTYTLFPGSATPVVDYGGPFTGVLLFAANQTTRTFTIPIVNNTLAEGPETVLLQLSSPTGGALLGPRQSAVLTIIDNDAGGALRFSKATYSVNEGTASAAITVTRSGGAAGNVSVDVAVVGGNATPGADFTIPGALIPDALVRLTFAAGQASRSFTINMAKDSNPEPNETILLALQNPQGGASLGSPAAATLTIVDNDRVGTFQFSAATYSVQESAPVATLTITRTGSTSGAGSVEVSFQDGTAGAGICDGSSAYDYAPPPNPQILNFAPGQSSKTVSVPICGNTAVDGTRTFTAQLSSPSPSSFALGTIGTATVNILNDDATVQFAATEFTVGEGSSSASVVVTRTGGTSQSVVVSYLAAAAGVGAGFATPAVSPGSCNAGADFRPISGTLTFASGQTSKTLPVPLCGDSIAGEGDEAFSVSLTGIVSGPASLGALSSTTVVIQENDGGLLRLGASTYTANEGSASVAITLQRSGSLTNPASVELMATAASATGSGSCGAGIDFIASTQIVAFAAGQSSKTATVPLCGDTQAEGTETFQVALQNPVGGALGHPAAATVNLTDNEVGGTLRWSVADVSGVEGTTVMLTVTRTNGTASDVTVEVTAEDGDADTPGADAVAGVDYESLPPTLLTFGANVSSQTIAIPLLTRDAVQGPRAFRVLLHDPTGGAALGSPSTVSVWVLDPG